MILEASILTRSVTRVTSEAIWQYSCDVSSFALLNLRLAEAVSATLTFHNYEMLNSLHLSPEKKTEKIIKKLPLNIMSPNKQKLNVKLISVERKLSK